MEGDTAYRPRSPHFDTYKGPIWRFVEKEVQRAYDADVSILEACNHRMTGRFLKLLTEAKKTFWSQKRSSDQ